MTTNEVQQILIRLAGMEATITGRFEQLAKDNTDADDLHRDHEKRLRALESVRWRAAGAVGLGGVVFGALVTYLASR